MLQNVLRRHLDTACMLAQHHLHSLSTEECLWQPTPVGPHVRRGAQGRWLADWPDSEDYRAGAPSIGWLTWHIIYWWSMVLDQSFGEGRLTKDDVEWPGDARSVVKLIKQLEGEWRANLERLSLDDLQSDRLTHWPFEGRPFADVAAWVALELTKNAAEIGYARFLYAARAGP